MSTTKGPDHAPTFVELVKGKPGGPQQCARCQQAWPCEVAALRQRIRELEAER